MQRNRLKNKVASGSKMMEMNGETYELLHAVKDTDHNPACPLMAANLRAFDEAVYWDAFKKYF